MEALISYLQSHMVNCTLLEWVGTKCQEDVYEISGAYGALLIYKSMKSWYSVLGYQISALSHNFSSFLYMSNGKMKNNTLFYLIAKHH